MLKQPSVLNPRLLALLAGAGHTDLIIIADAGLPVPPGVELIDVSLVPGIPSFLQVVDAVFNQLTQSARGIIRTGECTPYANIGLVAGVSF